MKYHEVKTDCVRTTTTTHWCRKPMPVILGTLIRLAKRFDFKTSPEKQRILPYDKS